MTDSMDGSAGGPRERQVVVDNFCPVSKSQVSVACAVVLVASLVMALPMHLAGLWMIWPFSVVTVCLFVYALVACAKPWRQVVFVSPETVRVLDCGVERWRSVTYWTRVVLRRGWRGSHVFLRSHGREVEVGVGRSSESCLASAQLLADCIHGSAGYIVEKGGVE